MPLPRLRFFTRFALGVAFATTIARAETPPAFSEGAAPTTTTSGDRAVVVLVGAAGETPELHALLIELLEREGVQALVLEQGSFGRQELLKPAPASGAVNVFVVPGPAGNVGLYFRASDGERFLLRNVVLAAGFDDVGREQIGQIVETAVISLLRSAAGLTRAEAQQALGVVDDPTERRASKGSVDERQDAAPPATSKHSRDSAPPSSPREVSRRSALESWFALRYAVSAHGPKLGVAHGPGLELGLGVARGWVLRGRVTGDADFAQTFTTDSISGEVTSLRWRFAADAGVALVHGHAVLASLGIGSDRSTVKPVATAGSSAVAAAAFVDTTAIAHGELRYEVGSVAVRIAAALGADFSLAKTHFDVSHDGQAEPLVQPWLVRPTASVALAICPRWAAF